LFRFISVINLERALDQLPRERFRQLLASIGAAVILPACHGG
jgi:hypothetical protein